MVDIAACGYILCYQGPQSPLVLLFFPLSTQENWLEQVPVMTFILHLKLDPEATLQTYLGLEEEKKLTHLTPKITALSANSTTPISSSHVLINPYTHWYTLNRFDPPQT